MKPKRVSFNSYRCFKNTGEITIDLVSKYSLIIGRNNSGKSSLIDIIGYIFNGSSIDKNILHKMDLKIGMELSEEDIRHGFREETYSYRDSLPYVKTSNFDYGKRFIGSSIIFSIKDKPSKFRMKLELLDVEHSNDYKLTNKHKRIWANCYEGYCQGFSAEYEFIRLAAERDIVPEVATDSPELSKNGNGATNLIRKLINETEQREELVEEVLLGELNRIMRGDAEYDSIRVQQESSKPDSKWEIYLQEKGGKRVALSNSGSGLKTLILVLLDLHIVPELKGKGKKYVYAFEELENNLHPSIQRRLFDYLYDYSQKESVRIFLTSHSHVAINAMYGRSSTKIYHVTKSNMISTVTEVDSYKGKKYILDDCGVKASDLLQANGIIWVEGPSDRIYIERWLKVFESNKYVEGKDYHYAYYGGRLLSHYEAVDEDLQDGIINMLRINRNAAIVIDSDKKNSSASINATKKRIQNEFRSMNAICWITEGKEIENYLLADSINSALGCDLTKNISRYQLFPNYIKGFYKNFESNKVSFAKKIAPFIKDTSNMDLKERIKEIYLAICQWNGEAFESE